MKMSTREKLNQDNILMEMDYLDQWIEGIGDYPDKSLFFQQPHIIESWVALVREIQKIKPWDDSVDKTKWRNRTETYVEYLLSLRDLHNNYKKLYQKYNDQIKELLNTYDGWLGGKYISSDGIEALSAENYEDDLEAVEDIIQHLTKMNSDSLNARAAVHSVLTDIHFVLMAVMNRGGHIVIGLNPSDSDFAKAIDLDLKEWTRSFGKDMFREMTEDLNRHYKQYRTAPYTTELWGEMLDADEDALKLAKLHQLAENDSPKQEHWGEDRRILMDENGRLMQQIYASCRTDELLDLGKAENIHPFISLLTLDNLSMFYEIIVRRSLIQCEMFSELKTQHEAWLNDNNEESDNNEEVNEELNYNAPMINLQRLLQQEWFADVRTDDKYDATWTDDFIFALMSSDWKDCIAKDWAISGVRNKRKQIKGYIIGLLKDNGVIKGSYDKIARRVGIMKVPRNFSNYMGKGKKQPFADWVKEYITPSEVAE